MLINLIKKEKEINASRTHGNPGACMRRGINQHFRKAASHQSI